MNTATIRRQLHSYLEVAEDKKIKAIYTMMEEDIKESAVDYTDEFKAELDKRYEEYKKDGKVVTRKAMDKQIKKMLGKTK